MRYPKSSLVFMMLNKKGVFCRIRTWADSTSAGLFYAILVQVLCITLEVLSIDCFYRYHNLILNSPPPSAILTEKINKQCFHLSNLHSIYNYALWNHWLLGKYIFLKVFKNWKWFMSYFIKVIEIWWNSFQFFILKLYCQIF